MSAGLSLARIRVKRVLKSLLVWPGALLCALRKPRGLRVLFYHRVNPYHFAELGPVSREITVSPAAFEEQLRWLRERGYKSLNTAQWGELLARGIADLDEKTIAITFDDGYEDNLLWAAPLLQQYGFAATVFPVADFLGRETGDVWPHADPPGLGKFLSPAQVGELAAYGVGIGSHTSTHPMLARVSDEQVRRELQDSRALLERVGGTTVDLLVYPAGDFDARTEEAAAKAGYAASFTTIPGINSALDRPHALRRTEVSASDSFFIFRMKMRGALDWLAFKESPAFRRAIGCVNVLFSALASRPTAAPRA